MPTIQTLIIALIGGILPALLWLWFWLKEDAARPEPRRLILLSFVAGMVVVALVLPAERFVLSMASGTALIIAWATIEEVFKYVAARVTVLRNKECNEPIDAVIYMITIALGFAAVENTLFLLSSLVDGNFVTGLLTGNLRFLGATLLHTLSSAIIGIAIALSFYKSIVYKRIFRVIGIILAITLHAMFNFFILHSNGEKLMTVFFFVWIGIIVLILIFEKVKRITNPHRFV